MKWIWGDKIVGDFKDGKLDWDRNFSWKNRAKIGGSFIDDKKMGKYTFSKIGKTLLAI